MFLGVDVGTGGTRAVLVDHEGRVVASESCEHQPIRSAEIGWAEQDPEDWWHAAQLAISGVMHSARAANWTVESIGLTGQMHGCVMLDADGNVLRPALIWCDQRTQPQCDWLTESIGRERLIELTCNPALPNFTLTKLLWVRQHQPQIFARIAHVLCPKDYVRYRLTGEYAMDMQEASGTLLLDVTHRRWSVELAEEVGIPLAWLPTLFEGPEICGRITPAAAQATGLAVKTPVVAGAGDQGAGAVGMGILRPGSVSATIGTSGVVFAATAEPTKDPLGRLHTFCHAAPGVWHVMGVTNGAGLSLRYFRDTLAPSFSYDELTQLASQVAAGSDGMLWVPYLFGERTPHLDPNARAAFLGITASHTLGHFARAVLEGVAFSLKDTFTLFAELGIPVDLIRLVAAARAVRSGGRSRPMSTVSPCKCSKPTRAERSEQPCLPGPASERGSPSRRRARRLSVRRKPSIPCTPQKCNWPTPATDASTQRWARYSQADFCLMKASRPDQSVSNTKRKALRHIPSQGLSVWC